ncbi:gamma-glutamyl cyclotransferase, AIG2-like (plasmid) [Aliarcobacter cibarius]|uniref:gamma-glutamylcyclotransferase family protein n=1 Tax=Aliarcobacter cibarius TaxID=255507 RepID=UPI00124866A2|nr:gamma-glutamylcyclotransferase family protein [Aliarcobacter cibarius]QEZ90202.1 gamma-glutamyl cyclotransferase, AIG2-like [Aliarcobacter cibarius]
MKEIYVFTYGTLKKGFSNNHFLNDAIFISNAITCDNYQMYPCSNKNFPFLIKSENVQQIKGEVFKTNSKKVLDDLDYLENYPNLYLKEFIKVKLENNSIVEALVYFKNEKSYLNAVDYSMPINEWNDNYKNSFLI